MHTDPTNTGDSNSSNQTGPNSKYDTNNDKYYINETPVQYERYVRMPVCVGRAVASHRYSQEVITIYQ
jgi:hypothetical protein